MWAKRSLSVGHRGQYSGIGGLGESVSRGGSRVAGFGVGADPVPAPDQFINAFTTFTSDQKAWITSALNTLNSKIMSQSGTSCATWADPAANLGAALGCFQAWYNSTAAAPGSSSVVRTDGVLDQQTLAALLQTVAQHPGDFPTPFPAGFGVPAAAPTPAPAPVAPSPAAAPVSPAPAPVSVPAPSSTMSTGAKVAIGVGAAAAVSGAVYAATRIGGGKRRGRRR